MINNPENVNKELDRLEKFLADENYAQALAVARKLSQLSPKTASLHLTMAICYTKLEKGHKAMRVIQRMRDLFPYESVVLLDAARIALQLEELRTAADIFEHVLRTLKDGKPKELAAIRCEYGVTLWEMHRKEEAIVQWQQALTEDPSNSHAKANLGAHLNEFGEPRAVSPAMDEFFHFINIHKRRYFALHGQENFETKGEAAKLMAKIQLTWNEKISPMSRDLDKMSAAEKSKLFKSIEIDFDA